MLRARLAARMLRANVATIEATADEGIGGRPRRVNRWTAWWYAGTRLDWGFAALSTLLVAAGYQYAWVTRHNISVPKGADAPYQAAFFLVALYLVGAGVLARRRDSRPESVVPEGYELSAVGCALFLAGILINYWWTEALGTPIGVPAIFRLPNLLQIAGGVLIVVGPLRASVARGELGVNPPALVSSALLLATVTFFTQFDHPYVDMYASKAIELPPPNSPFDLADHREEILGALGLMMQATAVVGVVLWVLRQTRLPPGSLTLMITATALATAYQLGHYEMVFVGAIVGVLADVALVVIGPRADRVLRMHLFAVLLGAALAAVYLIWVGINPGTWYPADVTYGTVLACAIAAGLMSYVLFPGADAQRAASVLWPALTDEPYKEAPDVTVERVEHALRVLHSTRDLADNPLVGMRSVAAPTAGELRRTLEAAIEHLRTSNFQQDAQAGQILDLYYVRRIGGHYAVIMRVGLSRAAYFNRRSYGVRRVVDRLRELEEAVQTV